MGLISYIKEYTTTIGLKKPMNYSITEKNAKLKKSIKNS